MTSSSGLIAGRYQPLEAGRSGTPQRARDLQTAQSVLLREVTLPRESADEAFARALTAKGIFHPSLVTLFDVLRLDADRVLLAYEFVPAQTVAQVSGGMPFHLRRVAEVMAELGDAVAELHARDIAHGGISQATVLITMKGKVKLDRVADPSLNLRATPSIDGDLAALGDLLRDLVGRPPAGTQGVAAIETIANRAREGRLTAATFAAMLRRP
jgi:serine/threonine protein kinase